MVYVQAMDSQPVNLRIPKDALAQIDALARAANMTRTAFMIERSLMESKPTSAPMVKALLGRQERKLDESVGVAFGPVKRAPGSMLKGKK